MSTGIGTTRRSLLVAAGAGPLAGAAVAWTTRTAEAGHPSRLTPRERLQLRHLPDVPVVTHLGSTARFYRDLVKDRKVIINFGYAECDGICAPVTANLVQVQHLLGDRVGRDIFMLSVSLRPTQDTPAVMRAYAAMHRVGPGWLFLTGKPADIESLRQGLGFVYSDPVEDAVRTNHIGIIRFGDEPAMRWAACPALANPRHIVRTIGWDFGADPDGRHQRVRGAPG